MKKLNDLIKEELDNSELSNVFGGRAVGGGDPCCSFTIFSDGSTSDCDEDCEAPIGF